MLAETPTVDHYCYLPRLFPAGRKGTGNIFIIPNEPDYDYDILTLLCILSRY